MKINRKYVVLASFFLLAPLTGLGISKTARADYGSDGHGRAAVNAICQSDQADAGDSRYAGHDCGENNNPQVLVPAQSYSCFYLTDITVFGNNPTNGGGHEIDLEDGTNSRAVPPKVVFVAPWSSTAPTVASQDWKTPIVFTGNLYADVHDANNNIIVTVSGFYAGCPR